MSGKHLLEMKNIGKSFPGVRALDGVNFTLDAGEVHVLIGENGAGKSTLMKIIGGTYVEYDGEMYLDGEPVAFRDIKDAQNHAIATIHQELNQVPVMTVAENLFLGREPMQKNKVLIDDKRIVEQARQILHDNTLDIDPNEKLGNLPVSQRQMLEIAKAVSSGAKIIIMDEPTSALSAGEVALLFSHIRRLKKAGAGIIYISHRMEEMFEIGDTVTVLRDGKFIKQLKVADTNRDEVISLMVGRELEDIYPKYTMDLSDSDTVFEVKNLTGEKFRNVSFSVKRGELVGIAGLMGAGRTELVRAIFGLDPIYEGEILLEGKPIKIKDTRAAVKSGILMVSEDRKKYGLVHILSISDNIGLPNLKKFTKGGLIRAGRERAENKKYFEKLGVKAPNMNYLANTLSGGNQQKVVLAKWLEAGPKVLIMDEPTRGIDVGAKHEIYEIMLDLLKQGVSIIMISSDMPEIIGMCHRILVMREHELSGELRGDEITQKSILNYAMR